MSTTAPPAAAGAPTGVLRWLRWARRVGREWGWRHVGWSVVAAALFAFNMGGVLHLGLDLGFWAYIGVYNVLQYGLPYVFALRMADHAVADGVRPLHAYGTVVLTVAPLGALLLGPALAVPMDLLFEPWDQPARAAGARFLSEDDLRLLSMRVLPFVLLTLAYAQWRREQRLLARARTAELGRAQRERQLQSARLLALQARVEPQFLFDTLHRVRTLIDHSAASAERLLADLIALLRAMQPAADATASTVRREFGLVEAFARASEAPALQAPQLVLSCDEATADARLAPMLLLPLLRRLAEAAPRAHWRVQASAAGTRLVLAVHAAATEGPADGSARGALAALDAAALQARLRAVHGDDATVAVDARDGASITFDVLLHAEHDTADRPDR